MIMEVEHPLNGSRHVTDPHLGSYNPDPRPHKDSPSPVSDTDSDDRKSDSSPREQCRLQHEDPNARRYRTAFSREQLTILERQFSKQNYVTRPKRCELAAELGLSESTIKIWFQNRRMKDKRQRMTVAWPFGVADPALLNLFASAAQSPLHQYPYAAVPGVLPGVMPMFNQFAPSPVQHRSSARYSPYSHGGVIRPSGTRLPQATNPQLPSPTPEQLAYTNPLLPTPTPEQFAHMFGQSPLNFASIPPLCLPVNQQMTPPEHHLTVRTSPTSGLCSPVDTQSIKSELNKPDSPCGFKEMFNFNKKSDTVKRKPSKSSKSSKATIFRPFVTDEQ